MVDIVYKQRKINTKFIPPLSTFIDPEQKMKQRIKELMFRGKNSYDISVKIINDGTIKYYDTVFKTFIAFRNEEHPTKVGLSLYWIPKNKIEGEGLWIKMPCTTEMGTENKQLETIIEDLLVLLCLRRLIHVSHLPGMTINLEYTLRGLLEDVWNPEKIMKKAMRKFYEIRDKV